MSINLPIGLENISNSCYLNSVIQNIVCIPWLLRRVQGEIGNPTTARGALITVIKRLNSNTERNPSTSPLVVRNAMEQYHPEIADSSYQDADDILQKIMNRIFTEEARLNVNNRIFTNHFQIKERHIMICGECDTISSVRVNDPATISLMAWDNEGHQLTELQQTLASLIIPETISEARCTGKCAVIAREQGRSLHDGGVRTNKGMNKWTIIEYAPRMMVMNVAGTVMSGHKVEFPLEIDMARYIYPVRFVEKRVGKKIGPIRFRLSGTFRHHGNYPHYTATVRLDSGGREWAYCDDSRIQRKDWRFASSENVNSMFYECYDWPTLDRIYKIFDSIKGQSKFWYGSTY